jgi:hypothetical protein
MDCYDILAGYSNSMKDYATEEAALIELLEISKKHDIST